MNLQRNNANDKRVMANEGYEIKTEIVRCMPLNTICLSFANNDNNCPDVEFPEPDN